MKVSPRVITGTCTYCGPVLSPKTQYLRADLCAGSFFKPRQCFSSLKALRLKRRKTVLKWINAIIYLRLPVLASKGKLRKLVINSPSILLSEVINMAELVPIWKLPTVHFASNRPQESRCSFYRHLSAIFRDTSSIWKLLFVSNLLEKLGTTSSTSFNRTTLTMFLVTGILDKFHFHPFEISFQFNSSVRE